jgi:DNA-binding MurR/RpiR family transcriptional regulator
VPHVQVEIANIRRSFEGTPPQTFEAAVDLLHRAKRIWLIGFRGSHPLAELASFWLKYLRRNVSFLPSGWMTFAEDAIDMGPGDTVFAIGLRRRPSAFRGLLENAHAQGASILLLTDLSASLSARYADVVLRCHNRSTTIFDSLAPAISMINFLLGALALRQGDEVRGRLERIEALADRLDTIGPPAPARKARG